MSDGVRRGEYRITTDRGDLDVGAIHDFLTRSYWSPGVPLEVVERAIANSLCFGLLHGSAQVGFARVVTDKATFAYLSDVYVLEAHRGKGLSKWLLEAICGHEELQGLRRFMLATRDAHGEKTLRFSKGKLGAVVAVPKGKSRITIRLDEAGGGNYQSLINAALREHVGRLDEPLEKTLRRVLRAHCKSGKTSIYLSRY